MSTNTTDGKIIALSVYDVIPRQYNWLNNSWSFQFNRHNLNTNDTYICIFGNGQDEELKFFEKQTDIKIIYRSPKAVNRRPLHGTEPRNTLVIFELASDISSSQSDMKTNESIPAV